MNLLGLFFTFLAYGLFVAMYNGDSSDAPVFPEFEAPGVSFQEIPDDCGGFLDGAECVAKTIVNVVLGVVYLVLLIVEIIRILVALFVLIAVNAFTGFDSAPEWINVLLAGTFGVAAVIIIYRAVRKGDTDSA